MLSCRGHLYVPGNKYINTIREAAECIVNICLMKGGDCLFKRPVNGKKATTIPLKKAVVFEKDIYRKPTKNTGNSLVQNLNTKIKLNKSFLIIKLIVDYYF